MSRKADTVYVEVGWDLYDEEKGEDGGRFTLQEAGVTRIVGIPADVFNDCLDVAPENWVADYLSGEYGWCVNGWCFT